MTHWTAVLGVGLFLLGFVAGIGFLVWIAKETGPKF